MHRSINHFQKTLQCGIRIRWKTADGWRFSDDLYAFICIKHFKSIWNKLNWAPTPTTTINMLMIMLIFNGFYVFMGLSTTLNKWTLNIVFV